MIEANLDDQVTWSDLGIWCGKTCQEPSPQMGGQTSKPSSRRSSASSAKMLPMCLCLKRNGESQDASMEWEMMEHPFPWLISSTMHNGGAYPNVENGFAWYATSTGSPLPKLYLTLNIGEEPRVPNPTKLSDLLEENADPKYTLSSKACAGILRRAEKRGKELPPVLKEALENQLDS